MGQSRPIRPRTPGSSHAPARLESWKEIAAHLNRTPRTVQRWEAEEGLPVHRLHHNKGDTVYALTEELDAWWERRQQTADEDPRSPPLPAPPREETEPSPQPSRWTRIAVLAAMALVLTAAGWLWRGRSQPETPLQPVPLTTLPGMELSPSQSPDGTQVAYSWNGQNQDNFDIYVQVVGSGQPHRLTTDPARDTSPAWSPDGTQIAFIRSIDGGGSALMLIPALGGPATLWTELSTPALDHNLTTRKMAWHPDGKHLVVAEPRALLLLSTDNRGEKRRLPVPASETFDSDAALCPDGRTLVFSWNSSLFRISLDDNLAAQGEPVLLTEDGKDPVCTPDSRDIVFIRGDNGVNIGGIGGLFRMPASGAGPPRLLASLAGENTELAIARDGSRLIYSERTRDRNIWSTVLSGPEAGQRQMSRVSSTLNEFSPQFSPNGSRVAFQSNRSGYWEIWVCDSDGSDCRPLTDGVGRQTGTPRWSPDGRRIAFDSLEEGEDRNIFIVDADGGNLRRLTSHPRDDRLPSWSRDGKWIYFCSRRTGDPEVWKLPAEEGAVPGVPIRVTRNGGSYPFESPDGKFLYYTKGAGLRPPTTLWRMPVDGGEETQVIDAIATGNSYAVVDDGIYYLDSLEPGSSIKFLRLATGEITTIATIDAPTYLGCAVSPNRQTLLYTQYDTAGSDLMLIDNFR